MSMSDTQDDNDDDTTGSVFPGQVAGLGQPRPPQESDEVPGSHEAEGPPDDRPEAIRQRQRDFVPNLLVKLRDKAQSNYPEQERTEGTSGPRKAVGAALEGANENYPENEQQGGGTQLIMRLLAGADADPQLTQQAEQAATQALGSDPSQPPNQSDVRLMALHLAAEHGGDEAGYKVQQTYRASYNVAMGHAHVALSGAGGKPADLAAATDAATKAATYVLDGTTTTFQPSGGGVTATVKYPGNQQPKVFQLTVPQFNQLTDVGDINGGQYDAVHENGATLQKIAQGPGKPIQAPQQGAPQQAAPQAGLPPAQGAPQGQPRPQTPQTPAPTARGPDAHPFVYASDEGVDPMLAKRSHALFPTVGQEQQRLQYIDKMQQQGVVNRQAQDKIDRPFGVQQLKNEGALGVQGAKNEGAQGVAATKAAAYIQHADIVAASKDHDASMKMASDIYKIGMQSADRQTQTQGMLLGKKISASGMSGEPLTPQDVEAISQFSKRAVNTPQAPTPQVQAPQAQASQAQAPSPQNPAGSGKFTPPAGQGWLFNAAKQQYRDQAGKIYDINGKPVQSQ